MTTTTQSPAELVNSAFAQAQNYAADAQAKLTKFTDQLNAALQIAPLSDVTFAPVAEPSASTVADYVAPADYTDSLLTSLADVIATRLQGGTGLAPSVETAIWDRDRERQLAGAQAAIDQISRDAEALGFELPAGVLNDGIRRETRAYYDKVSTLSREVAIKQADLEQANMQQAIEKAIGYEQMLADIIAKRATVSVQAYEAEVDRFKAEVMQDVERWKAQIEQYNAEVNYVLTSEKMNTEVLRANLATVLEAAKTGAQVYAQLTASAYALIHAQATISGSSGTTVGYQYSNQTLDQPSALPSI